MTRAPIEIIRIGNDHCGSNSYIVPAPGSPSAVVIDPADVNSHRVRERLLRAGYTKLLIVLTHEHFDHISGVTALRASFDTKVVASMVCSQHVSDPRKNLSRYSIGIDISCEAADMTFEATGANIVWEDLDLELVPTPGHSAGSICVGIERNLFTGDTIIPGFPTVVKLPGGDRIALRTSVCSLMKRFPQVTDIYPGHGDPCRLSDIDPSDVLGANG